MFLYLYGFKIFRPNILMKILDHLSRGLKWFLTYSWYFSNLSLWFLCTYTKKTEKLRGTTVDHEMLAKLLQKFAERELFNISKFQCGGAKKEDVYKKFVEKEAKYHKRCYTQYDQNHSHQVPPPPIEKSSEPNVLLYPLVEWCALFATNQTQILLQQEWCMSVKML